LTAGWIKTDTDLKFPTWSSSINEIQVFSKILCLATITDNAQLFGGLFRRSGTKLALSLGVSKKLNQF